MFGKLYICNKKNEIRSLSHTKSPETLKLLKENKGLFNDFFVYDPQNTGNKRKNRQMRLHKI